MGYDTRPLLSLQEKEKILGDAVNEDTLLFLEHDPHHMLISLIQTEKGVRMKESFTLTDYFAS